MARLLENSPNYDIRRSGFADDDPTLKSLTDEEAVEWRDNLVAKIAAVDQDAQRAIADFQAGRKRAEEALEVSDYKKLKRGRCPPKAPYYRQHQIATAVERLLAVELGVDWGAYDREVSSK
jgi:hypothetical protein